MREILFKAKRLDNNEWVEGFFVNAIEEYGNGERTAEIIKINAERICSGEYSYLESYVVDINTLCQYTGLTDKNGNKIWENDILLDDIKSVVRWDDEEARFVIDDYGTKGCVMEYGFDEDAGGYGVVDTLGFDDFYTMQSFEVIGNKFDNPELLGV